jgi:hypothetical protein
VLRVSSSPLYLLLWHGIWGQVLGCVHLSIVVDKLQRLSLPATSSSAAGLSDCIHLLPHLQCSQQQLITAPCTAAPYTAATCSSLY